MEYTKTEIKINGQLFRETSYNPRIEQVNIGDIVVIENSQYVHYGFGSENFGEIYLFHLMPKHEWDEMQQRIKKQRAWPDAMKMMRNALAEKPLREGIEPQQTLHPLYALEDLC